MNKRISIVLAVAAIMITAGCTGLIPGGDDALNGFNEDGVNTSVAMASHQDALTDAETWRTTLRTTYDSEANLEDATERKQVNHNTSTMLLDFELGSFVESSYVTESERFRQRQSPNTTFYDYQEAGYDINESSFSPTLSQFIDNLNYSLESDRGDTLRYQADGVAQDSIFDERGPQNSTVENLSSTLVVNERGYVSEFRFTGTTVSDNAEDVEMTLTIQFSDVGTTTVPEPAWVSEAQNETVQ